MCINVLMHIHVHIQCSYIVCVMAAFFSLSLSLYRRFVQVWRKVLLRDMRQSLRYMYMYELRFIIHVHVHVYVQA